MVIWSKKEIFSKQFKQKHLFSNMICRRLFKLFTRKCKKCEFIAVLFSDIVWIASGALRSEVYKWRTTWCSLLLELNMIRAISHSHSTLSSYAFFIKPNLRFVNVTWKISSNKFKLSKVIRSNIVNIKKWMTAKIISSLSGVTKIMIFNVELRS